MSDLDREDADQNRFLNQNPTVQTERVQFDVSDLPIGPLLGIPEPDDSASSDSEFSEKLDDLRCNLFLGRDSPLLPSFDNQYQSSTSLNQVTMGSRSWIMVGKVLFLVDMSLEWERMMGVM
jgi:hypothetical protein